MEEINELKDNKIHQTCFGKFSLPNGKLCDEKSRNSRIHLNARTIQTIVVNPSVTKEKKSKRLSSHSQCIYIVFPKLKLQATWKKKAKC